MPTLKSLTCRVELVPDNVPLDEHGTAYRDGFVQSLVVAPNEQTAFTIHLTSDSYIAPGLGVFVFIDSVYQCNRVRRGLQPPGPGVSPMDILVNMRLRQKEERVTKGVYIGRDWTFGPLLKSESGVESSASAAFVHNVGGIQVVVLRCLPEDKAGRRDVVSQDPAGGLAERVTEGAKRQTRSTASHKSEKSSLGLMGLFDGNNDSPPRSGADRDRADTKEAWTEWTRNRREFREHGPFVIPPESVQRINADAAKDRSHQLHTGRGAMYSHKTASPRYLDTMERPYAVFWFGYRSREAIQKMLGESIPDPKVRMNLMQLSKEELVRQLADARAKEESQKSDGPKSDAGTNKARPDHATDGKSGPATGDKFTRADGVGKVQTRNAWTNTSKPPSARGSDKGNGSKWLAEEPGHEVDGIINLGTKRGSLDWSKEPEGQVSWGTDATNTGGSDAAPAAKMDWNSGIDKLNWTTEPEGEDADWAPQTLNWNDDPVGGDSANKTQDNYGDDQEQTHPVW